MRKTAVASNLNMRFYTKDGWTKEELDKFCVKGEVEMPFPQDENPYFVLKHGGFFDSVKLAEVVSVERSFPEQHRLSDVQLIEEQQ